MGKRSSSFSFFFFLFPYPLPIPPFFGEHSGQSARWRVILLQLSIEAISTFPLFFRHDGHQVVKVRFAQQQSVAQFDDLCVVFLFLLAVLSGEMDHVALYRFLGFRREAIPFLLRLRLRLRLPSLGFWCFFYFFFFFFKRQSERDFGPVICIYTHVATYRASCAKSSLDQTLMDSRQRRPCV